MSENLVWIDLEFSGLNPEKDVILEIATIVTDADLNVIAEGPNLAIHTSDDILGGMDDWNQEHHGASGLIDRVKASTESHESADEATQKFIAQHCPSGSSPCCGNSIHQDRRYLYRYMPLITGHLHYRNIDVSSLKELAKRWYPELPSFPKKKSHEALDDIRESIGELQYYRKHILR